MHLIHKILGIKKRKVCFFVINSSVFPAKSVFEEMMDDPFFDPYIVIIPDTLRSQEYMFEGMKKSYDYLKCQYKNVYNSYDYKKSKFIDFTKKCDIVWTANPYDCITHKFYSIDYTHSNNKLVLYTIYGYQVSNWYENLIQNDEAYKKMTLVFAESKDSYDNLIENKINSVLLGYPKIDSIANAHKETERRKTIIVAPHHTVINWKDGVNFSQFLNYSDFFLELPKIYKEIDFVFRPHPLLFENMKIHKIWDEERIEKYLRDLAINKNVIYDTSSDYFNIFANSDGLIHDCGSFMAEYLVTGNPACYLLKNEDSRKIEFNNFANKCIDNHYKAFKKDDIIEFIDNVIVKGEDSMKEKRIAFVNTELKMNYPNSAKVICKYIKGSLI
mgnify:CR=1 FL=1